MRVVFDDLSQEQQERAFENYRKLTGDTDTEDVVKRAVFYGLDWNSETGEPWLDARGHKT